VSELTLAGLSERIGRELGVSDWMAIDQERIDAFASCTGDRQWIHVDVERATRGKPVPRPDRARLPDACHGRSSCHAGWGHPQGCSGWPELRDRQGSLPCTGACGRPACRLARRSLRVSSPGTEDR